MFARIKSDNWRLQGATNGSIVAISNMAIDKKINLHCVSDWDVRHYYGGQV